MKISFNRILIMIKIRFKRILVMIKIRLKKIKIQMIIKYKTILNKIHQINNKRTKKLKTFVKILKKIIFKTQIRNYKLKIKLKLNK